MLPLPPVTISPWELPPDCDAPLTAPATFVLFTRWGFGSDKEPLPETELWFRSVPYKHGFLHYFCDGAHVGNGNWILSDRGRHNPLSWERLDRDWLTGIFQNELWSHFMMRLLYFEGAPYGYPGLHRIKISPEGGCVLGTGQDGPWDPQHPCIPFKMTLSGKKAPARSETVKRQLLSSIADENSEAFLALRWIHLSPDQRKEDLFSLQNGTLSEMEAILQAVLQSQEGIWQNNETLCWRTYYGDFIKRSSDLAFAHSPSAPYLLECDVPQRLEQWKQIVSAYFVPTLDIARFRFARNVDEEPNSLSVEANPPTAHERLEAQLLLRHWWQQKLTPLLFESNTTQP